MIISKTLIRQYAYDAGFRGTHLDAAVDIAVCESGLNINSHCLNCFEGIKEDSRGLWQINLNAHPQYKTVDLFNPKINAIAAFEVYKEAGSTFRPWFNCATKLGYLNFPNTESDDPEKKKLNLFAFVAIIGLYLLSKD